MKLLSALLHPRRSIRRLLSLPGEMRGLGVETRGLGEEMRDLASAQTQLHDALVQAGGLPLPPPHLQRRVAGRYDATWVSLGTRMLSNIQDFIAPLELTSFERILDFGCGPGRVTRALHYATRPEQELHGCDIDPEAIEWCRANYGAIATFTINPHAPPAPYPANTFDFVCGVSVFTHLPEEHQRLWLDELHRIAKPGAHIFLSFHGELHYHAIPPELRDEFEQRGFVYFGAETTGLPDFYRVTVHRPDYIREHWGTSFEVLSVEERVMGKHGGALLRKRVRVTDDRDRLENLGQPTVVEADLPDQLRVESQLLRSHCQATRLGGGTQPGWGASPASSAMAR